LLTPSSLLVVVAFFNGIKQYETIIKRTFKYVKVYSFFQVVDLINILSSIKLLVLQKTINLINFNSEFPAIVVLKPKIYHHYQRYRSTLND
jgi:hypothetical protein